MNELRQRVQKTIVLVLAMSAFTCSNGQGFPEEGAVYKKPDAAIEARVEDLLKRMTLEEKIGQMAQVEKNSIRFSEIPKDFIGSVLSGGGGYPYPNNPAAWADMTDRFQKEALKNRLAIPLIYGADAVHGHNNVAGAVIFPHNIGLGATREPELVRRIGRVTALEMCATGVFWNFAPTVAVPQDIRWGRTYEGYSENTELVTLLGTAYLHGLQNAETAGLGSPGTVLATPKHYVGDGATEGRSEGARFAIDQGTAMIDEATLRKVHLPPYAAAVKEGARCIMVSFSSWKDKKMHAHKYLLTDVLKGELGFSGFLISDWKAIDQLPGDYASDVRTSVNAGLDMIMTPDNSRTLCQALKEAVEKGDVPLARIDDAVRRILRVKFELGLFERPFADRSLLPKVGSPEHRALAREAVRKSLVLLKNRSALPLSKGSPVLFVAGEMADNLGWQCGGWSIEWQGGSGVITEGTTILKGIQEAVADKATVVFDPKGEDGAGKLKRAPVGIVVVGEKPYAEGSGDRADLSLGAADVDLVRRVRARVDKLIVIIVSGRPLVITEILDDCDALVAAWLPGTEGAGVADVLFGDFPFTGKLSYTWPRTNEYLPLAQTVGKGALFPYGFGLK